MYDTAADQVSTGFKGYAGIFAQRRKYDYSDQVIHKARIHAKKFNMLSKNLTKMSVTELEPRIFEYTEPNDVIAIRNNPGTGTSFEVDNEDGLMLQQGDKLYVLINSITAAPSQETLKVTAVGAKDSGGAGEVTITVTRGGSPINISTGSDYSLIWGGNSIGENQAGSAPRNKEPNYTYNYVQLFDKTVGESEDVKNSEFYGKDFFSISGELMRARDRLMKEINWTLYLGERDTDTAADGNLIHHTGGMYEFIPTANRLDMSTNMSINYWNEISSTTLFVQGNDRHEKFLFAGPKFLVEFENMYTQYYQLDINNTLSQFFGVEVKTATFSGGKIHLVREECFVGTGYADCAFLEDLDYVAYMYLANRDIQVADNVTDPSERWNKEKRKIFGRIGLFRTYDAAHFFLYNPSAPS